MKLGIVIPLKAKCVSKNWATVERMLERTLQSVLNQANSQFSVAVIGHDCPDFLRDRSHHGSRIFIPFDSFAPPVIDPSNEEENQDNYEIDRCGKLLKGITELDRREGDITHWFALDADDLVHSNLVQYLVDHDGYDAYLFEQGYFYFARWNILNRTNEFAAYCGSSSVIAHKFFNLPIEIKPENIESFPFGAVSHVDMKDHFIESGMALHCPTEPLVMYVRATGENISDDGYVNTFYRRARQAAGMLLRRRPISSELRTAFAL